MTSFQCTNTGSCSRANTHRTTKSNESRPTCSECGNALQRRASGAGGMSRSRFIWSSGAVVAIAGVGTWFGLRTGARPELEVVPLNKQVTIDVSPSNPDRRALITLKNRGKAVLLISEASFGANAEKFSITGTEFPLKLKPDEEEVIRIEASKVTKPNEEAVLNLLTNDEDKAKVRITINTTTTKADNVLDNLPSVLFPPGSPLK